MRIAVLFALVRFGSASAEVECQGADYVGVCPSNGDDIAAMHMSLLQTGQHMRSGTEPDMVKDVKDVLVAKPAKGQEKAAKVAVQAPEKPQLHQHVRPGTGHDGLKEVQDWLEGAAAKAAKVAVKAQGNSAKVAVNVQDWLQGAEDLKEVQDVLEGAAAKAAKFAVKAQEKAQQELKDKLDAVRVNAVKSMVEVTEAVEASTAKLARKTERSKDDTTDVVPSPDGGRKNQTMKIDSLPHNATHYDKSSKIWPCEYPSMDCNKPDDSAASPFVATGFCSFALLALSVM